MREALKPSLETGNLERMNLRQRLSEEMLRDRVELMEVTAEVHEDEVLGSLLREAAVFGREHLGFSHSSATSRVRWCRIRARAAVSVESHS
jgi:hypothetical protein